MGELRVHDYWMRFGLKPLVFLACLIPFGLLLFGAVEGDLGANPLERVTDVTGQWGLRFLLLTLAITPLRRLGRNWQRLHRLIYAIGVLAVLHYIWLVKADLLEPLVYTGLLALLLAVRWRPQLIARPLFSGRLINVR